MKIKVSNVCQLVDPKYIHTIVDRGVTFTSNGDGSVTVNGTPTGEYYSVGTIALDTKSIKPNHQYLIYDINNTPIIDQLIIANYVGGYVYKGIGNIYIFPEHDYTRLVWEVRVRLNQTANNIVVRPQLFDLTEMYGAGNEPKTVAEFRKDFPNEMYEYSSECWKRFKELKYVTDKYGVVDLGTLTWNKYVNGNNWLFYATVPNGKTNVGSGNTVNAFIDRYNYSNIALSGSQAVVKNSPFVCWDATQSQILIKDTTYTDANTFKSSIVGVKLYYEFNIPGKGYLPLRRSKYIANKEPVQLLDKSKFYKTSVDYGVTWTNNGDGTITANGTATNIATYTLLVPNPRVIPGHKYLFISSITPQQADVATVITNIGGESGNGFIFTTDLTHINIYFYVRTNVTVSNVVFKPQLFDLTAMYGAGNEPTTVAQFRADYPNELYDYNPYNSITFR